MPPAIPLQQPDWGVLGSGPAQLRRRPAVAAVAVAVYRRFSAAGHRPLRITSTSAVAIEKKLLDDQFVQPGGLCRHLNAAAAGALRGAVTGRWSQCAGDCCAAPSHRSNSYIAPARLITPQQALKESTALAHSNWPARGRPYRGGWPAGSAGAGARCDLRARDEPRTCGWSRRRLAAARLPPARALYAGTPSPSSIPSCSSNMPGKLWTMVLLCSLLSAACGRSLQQLQQQQQQQLPEEAAFTQPEHLPFTVLTNGTYAAHLEAIASVRERAVILTTFHGNGTSEACGWV